MFIQNIFRLFSKESYIRKALFSSFDCIQVNSKIVSICETKGRYSGFLLVIQYVDIAKL